MQNKTIHILLADDDEGDRILFKDAIGELEINHVMNIVNNGKELMEYLKEEKTILPNLIFLDLNMPYKNGIECLKEIRSDKKFKNISIAVYSTSAAEKDIHETFLSGANIYIKKPNNFDKHKQVINKVVKTSKLYEDESFKRENFFLCI